MKIRLNKETEVNKLVEIWYEGSLIAHNFIDRDYWKSQQKEMEEKYLPISENYVISNNNDIVGFVSMVDNYLAALFLDIKHQGEGYGKELLNFIKRRRKNIQLKVYKKNNKAVNFYLENGFVIKKESLDEQTAEEEFLMGWEKD
ncbi:GNAT family N-acetyltransferase [Oceanobacillus piezotolerans]|uniref:GNAT family N-acetyltransferase n=1 Tax=Oceanobacillus piezotolerans TaxID=2448030 RepID=A0A498D632_9BACI|nr:GNAT family N-acetyltransferase [Oceanobacillus piezotolerans]RLL40594.1 GNAT family N-acetyltransferase [Oceanobacillus piezotolerans]